MANLKVCLAVIAIAVFLCLSDPVVARRSYSNPIAVNNGTNHTGPGPRPSSNSTNHTGPNPPQPPPSHNNSTNHTGPNPPHPPPHNNGTNHTGPNPPPHRNSTNHTGTDNGSVTSGATVQLSTRSLPVSNGKCIGSDCPSNIPNIPSIPSIPSVPSSDSSDDDEDEDEDDEADQQPQRPQQPRPSGNGSFPQPPPHNNGTNHTGPNPPPQPNNNGSFPQPPPHNNGTNHTGPNPPPQPNNHTKPAHGSEAECQNYTDCVNAIGGECLSKCSNSACVLTGYDRCRDANAVVVSVVLAKNSPSAKTIQKTRSDIVDLLGVPSNSVIFLGQEKNGNGLLFEILDSKVMTANDAVFSLLTQVRQQTKAVKKTELRGATVDVVRA